MTAKKNVIFTLDLEDHLGRYDKSSRYPGIARRILADMASKNIKGTVFVVGKIAETEPDLLREISDMGYEIACHSLDHVPLDQQTPEVFRSRTERAKSLLEDCIGKPITGFRAPIFSMIESTTWAADVLSDLGFTYSSSVMPARNPLYGFSSAPTTPFLWPTGLVELPCPVAQIGPITLPYLGGFYLRYLPKFMIHSCASRSSPGTCLWTYCHPYDFDHKEPFAQIAGAALWTSVLLWFNRRNTLSKILGVVAKDGGETLDAWVRENADALPNYDFPARSASKAVLPVA